MADFDALMSALRACAEPPTLPHRVHGLRRRDGSQNARPLQHHDFRWLDAAVGTSATRASAPIVTFPHDRIALRVRGGR